jgi:Ca2+-binding RTX toxin-like protein
MPRNPPPHATGLELTSTLDDPHFALSGDVDFASLTSPLGTLPGGPYDYAYVTTNASTPGIITIGDDLAALNGVIATGNGKDDIDLSNSTGNNLVYAGNGVDKVTGGAGDDFVFGGNGNDNLSGGAGADHVEGGNGVDVLNGNGGNDWLSGGNGKDTLTGGTDNGTAVVTFAATDADGNPVAVLPTNAPIIGDGATLTTGAAGTGNVLMEEGVFVDTATAPDTVYHVFSFTPTDVGPPGGSTAFVVGVFDSDGSLVDSFDVNMTEGVKNSFSLVDNDAVDDGGTVAVFTAGTVVPGTLAAAGSALDTEAYEPVTLTPVSVDITAGDVLFGGSANDTFVYNAGDGVDVINDYQRGDAILLHGIDPSEVHTVVGGGNTTLLFGDGAGGIAVNSAIELVGVTSQPHLVFDLH